MAMAISTQAMASSLAPKRLELGCDLALDLDQIGQSCFGHARDLQTLGHGGDFIQPSNEPLLFLGPLLFAAARNERWSRRRDLGTLFGEPELGILQIGKPSTNCARKSWLARRGHRPQCSSAKRMHHDRADYLR
jgi:hypothetical protein